MSFFEDASLVLIPSAQKTSKVYSVKPTDGTGDLTFTRSNDTATRVGPNGLIEKVRTNLVLQSNTFNTTWVAANSILTANAGTSPSGANDAWKIESDTIGSETRVRQSVTTTVGVEYSFSCFMKAGNVNWGIIRNFSISAGGRAWFDLQNGVVGAADSGITPSIESVGNGWYRCSITGTATTSGSLDLAPAPANSDFTSNAIGDYVLIYGAQGETGVTTAYIATTTAAVSVGPVANVPRLDYLNSSCPRLLLEPQRTNLFLQSEAINNAAWGAARYTRTANQTASPSGYIDADQCTPTATTGTHEIFPATGISFSATAYTMSLFAKYDGYNISLGVAGASTNWTGCVFDLQNGIAKTPQSAGSQSVCTAKIEDYGSGWYRCSITFTPYTTPTFYPTFGAVSSANATLGAWGAQDFTADGTSGTYLWGAQLEAGAYATSYIPTLGAAVTRGADACSKTGISSLIGQTAGTFFAEYTADSFASGARIVTLSDGTLNNRITLFCDGSEKIHIYAATLAGGQQIDQATTIDFAGNHKVAFAYANNDVAVYIDGTQAITSSSFSVPACSNMYLGSVNIAGIPLSGGIKQSLLFTSRLSNADLATLTA